MNKGKKFSDYDFTMFVIDNEEYIKYLYKLLPKDKVTYERFCKFCYICS